jgi:hypothetical protein
MLVVAAAAPASAEEAATASAPQTRAGQLTAQQAEKAQRVQEYVPNRLEKRLEKVQSMLSSNRPFYPFIGSTAWKAAASRSARVSIALRRTGRLDAHAGDVVPSLQGRRRRRSCFHAVRAIG